MSLGLDPPQVAAGGPSPSFKGTFAVDGRQGRREAASGVGFASHLPWYLACPVLAAHLSEVPMAIGWVKYFLFRLLTPLAPVCSSGPMACAPFPGAAEMRDEMRCSRCQMQLPPSHRGRGGKLLWP